MAKLTVYNLKGEKKKDVTLNSDVFGVEAKPEVMHRVVESILSNRRRNIAASKDRSQVRGGGAKPWKQKGTGRARAGSNRSPIWKGGGVTFGPSTERNYSKKVNKKEKKKSLAMSLSDKAQEKKIIIIDEIKFKDIKTKNITSAFKALTPIKSENALIVIPEKDSIVSKSAANLPRVETKLAANLNTYDILRHEYLVISLPALKVVEEMFTKK